MAELYKLTHPNHYKSVENLRVEEHLLSTMERVRSHTKMLKLSSKVVLSHKEHMPPEFEILITVKTVTLLGLEWTLISPVRVDFGPENTKQNNRGYPPGWYEPLLEDMDDAFSGYVHAFYTEEGEVQTNMKFFDQGNGCALTTTCAAIAGGCNRNDRIITMEILNILQCHGKGLMADTPQFWLQEVEKSATKAKGHAVPFFPGGRWNSLTTISFIRQQRELNLEVFVPQQWITFIDEEIEKQRRPELRPRPKGQDRASAGDRLWVPKAGKADKAEKATPKIKDGLPGFYDTMVNMEGFLNRKMTKKTQAGHNSEPSIGKVDAQQSNCSDTQQLPLATKTDAITARNSMEVDSANCDTEEPKSDDRTRKATEHGSSPPAKSQKVDSMDEKFQAAGSVLLSKKEIMDYACSQVNEQEQKCNKTAAVLRQETSALVTKTESYVRAQQDFRLAYEAFNQLLQADENVTSTVELAKNVTTDK